MARVAVDQQRVARRGAGHPAAWQCSPFASRSDVVAHQPRKHFFGLSAPVVAHHHPGLCRTIVAHGLVSQPVQSLSVVPCFAFVPSSPSPQLVLASFLASFHICSVSSFFSFYYVCPFFFFLVGGVSSSDMIKRG